MSLMKTLNDSLLENIKKSIEDAIPDSKARVTGGGGHFQLSVTSPAFEGKRMLEKHRMVLQSIKHLMAGDQAPVHAVDSIETIIPLAKCTPPPQNLLACAGRLAPRQSRSLRQC